jgi:DNA-directed RNA polymerase subunit RPC12/RpoP
MASNRQVTRSDRRKTALYLLAFVVVVVFSGAVILPQAWPMGLFMWLVVVGAALFLLVRWHAYSTVYHCAACGHGFTISTWTDLMAPHKPGAKYLKCPECGERDWTEVRMVTGDESAETGIGTEMDAEVGLEPELGAADEPETEE